MPISNAVRDAEFSSVQLPNHTRIRRWCRRRFLFRRHRLCIVDWGSCVLVDDASQATSLAAVLDFNSAVVLSPGSLIFGPGHASELGARMLPIPRARSPGVEVWMGAGMSGSGVFLQQIHKHRAMFTRSPRPNLPSSLLTIP